MTDFEYKSLLLLIKENDIEIDKIIKQYILLLSELTKTTMLSKDAFMNNLSEISNIGCIYVCYNRENNKINIIATGTIIFEPKISRNGSYVGHIEDIVVDIKYRSLGIANKIIEKLFYLANEKNCYKVILNCNEKLTTFYEKNGFKKNGIQMSVYL